MPKELIITMAAANRAGILAAVTRAMTELGGDLREASQTVVRGFFTMIFATEFPDSMDQCVIRDHLLDACRPFGIELSVRDPSTHFPVYTAATANTRQFRLRLGGRNQPGVLRKLSQVMSLRGTNRNCTVLHQPNLNHLIVQTYPTLKPKHQLVKIYYWFVNEIATSIISMQKPGIDRLILFLTYPRRRQSPNILFHSIHTQKE